MLHQLQMLAFNIHYVCSGMVKKVGSEQVIKYLTKNKYFTNFQHYLHLPEVHQIFEGKCLLLES